ncbi:Uncharacterised protein [uncultured archaeon]|nr:Uncharacterised protein [uncultured archaeon]
MRPALFAFLLLLGSLSAFSYPPHQNVSAHNDIIADSLLNSSCLNESVPSYDNPVKCAEMELLTTYPSVDSRISAEVPARILWRYVYSATSQEKSVPSSCIRSNHFLREFQNASIYANLTVLFRNYSNFTDNITSSPIQNPVPQEILNLTDGDNITFSLQGKIVFHYMQFNRICSPGANGSCDCDNTNYPFNLSRQFESNLTYLVEGGPLLHFLSKPVLHEQWSGNSQFEDLVFSKRKFYLASLTMGNVTIGNGTFYEFNITNDSVDAWAIASHPVSNLTNMSELEMEQRTKPITI